MMKKVLIGSFLLLLIGCFKSGPNFDKDGSLAQLGTPTKLEHYKHLDGKAFEYADTATFIITNYQELMNAIEEIKNAGDRELWKGASWDKLKLYYADTILQINTNNRKIGFSASGEFYYLDTENFITKKMNNK